jgi:hypothetical protein
MPTAPTDNFWRLDAECAAPDIDSEMFFPAKGTDTREPKKVCARCEVREECLAYALAHPREQGIWGGTTEFERTKLRRRMDRPVNFHRDTEARRAEVEQLHARNLSDEAISRLLGINRKTVAEDRRALNLPTTHTSGGRRIS